MRVDITAVEIELTDDFKDFVDKRVTSLGKFLEKFDDGTLLVNVEVGRTTMHHRQGNVYVSELILHLPGKTLRASCKDENVRMAVRKSRKTLAREIRKYRTAHIDR